MNRRGLTAAILLVWAIALALLVRREVWQPAGARLAEAALTLPPGATYYVVSLGNAQIGYASSTIDTLPDTLRVTDIMVLDVPVLGTVQRTETRTEAELSRTLRLRAFTATLRGPETRFAAVGHVEGDTVLELELTTDESHEVRRIRLEEPIVLPQLLPLRLAFGGELSVGRSYRLRLFDPVLLAARDITLEVTAESTFIVPRDTAVFDSGAGRWAPIVFDTVQAWRVRDAGRELTVDSWIDAHGQLVAARAPAGFHLERSAYELVYENYRLSGSARGSASAPDLVRTTAIGAAAQLVPESLATFAVRLSGQSLDGLDLDGGRQRLAGDTVIIQREPEPLRAAYRLPETDSAFRPFLEPEPLIQSDDPRIQAQARQIVGSTRRPERAAERLTRWVYSSVAKAVTIGIPSAIDVNARRRGDCNEHTVLYVALARAVGLPARTAAGLVYLDGTFYYHAWPEVWLGTWVAVDPTLGEFPADAAHVRLTIGGLARQLELVRLVGQLRVDVVQAGPTS
jgi:transglutaminase-like putative cysteine protease